MDSGPSERKPIPNARLRYEREKRGWVQGDVASKLCDLCSEEEIDENGFVDSKRISAWERGINKPEQFWRLKLEKLYGRSLEELGIIQSPDEDLPKPSKDIPVTKPAKGPISENRELGTTLQLPERDLLSANSISIPEGAVIFVVHNDTTSLAQIPTYSVQIDIGHNSGTYFVEAVAPSKSSETQVGQDTENSDVMDKSKRKTAKIMGVALSSVLLNPLALLNLQLQEHDVAVKPSTLDKTAISGIETLTEGYYQFLPIISNVVSYEHLILVRGHSQSLQLLLPGPLSPSIERRLYCVISTIAQIMGTMQYAMKFHTEAEVCFQTAAEYAQKSGNHALWAVALGRMGNFLIDTGKAQRAIEPLEAANRIASGSATATTRSWLAASEADAYANIGRGLDCDRAIGRAEDMASQIWPGQDPYRTLFDLSKLGSYKGACYVRLARKNDAQHAQTALGEALEQLNEVGSLRQCTLLRDLAIAFSLESNVEAACNVAEEALRIAQRAKSAMYVQRLHDFGQQHLTRWKDHQLVKAFDGRLQVAQSLFKTA